MAEHTVIQGDDFPYDFDSDGIDSFLSGWIGRWSIVDKIGSGGVSVASGTLAPSGDGAKMELRIKPSTTEAVEVGAYTLVVELANSSLNFKREVMQDKIIITKQGIVG